MNSKIDWHYHLSGRNIKKDIMGLKQYLEYMDEVYVMASYFPGNSSGLSNYNLYYHLKDIKQTKLYLSLDFEHYFFQGYNEMVNILEDDSEKIIGIKIYTGYQNIEYNAQFEMVLKLARKYNLYVMFHTGYLKGNKDAFNPAQLESIISSYKDIKFIIAHLGNPFIDTAIALLNKYDNLYTDISGLMDRRVELEETLNFVEKFAESVDNKKVLFGTDYPMQDYNMTKIFSTKFI